MRVRIGQELPLEVGKLEESGQGLPALWLKILEQS
jgi:hypothetical protein